MKKLVGATLFVAIVVGSLALFSPVPTASAAPCIYCPQIAIECGPCYQLVPQTCKRCAYCKRIPGCQP